MVPPWSSTKLRQRARPSPLPCCWRLRALSTWLNSWNSRSWSSGRMPMPVSTTETQTASRDTKRCSSPARSDGRGKGARVNTAWTEMAPFSGVNLEAFERRLKRICRTRTPSAVIRRSASGSISTLHSWRLAERRLAVSSTAPTTASRMSVSPSSSVMRPASILARSSTELIRPSR